MTKTEYNRMVGLVRKMREAQKRYFQSRDRNALVESKSLEKQVDEQLEKIAQEQKREGANLFQQPWD